MEDAQPPEPGVCRSCGAAIWWRVNPKTNKRSPWRKVYEYTDKETGELVVIPGGQFEWRSHFADCPNAKQHRGAR